MNTEEAVLRLAEQIKRNRAVARKKKKASQQVQDLSCDLTRGNITLHDDVFIGFVTKAGDTGFIGEREITLPRECAEALLSFLSEELPLDEVLADE